MLPVEVIQDNTDAIGLQVIQDNTDASAPNNLGQHRCSGYKQLRAAQTHSGPSNLRTDTDAPGTSNVGQHRCSGYEVTLGQHRCFQSK